MAKTFTPRLGLSQWSSDTDEHGGRTRVNADHQQLETLVAVWAGQGLLSARPAAEVEGRFYVSTNQGDNGRVSVDLGDRWVDISTLGGGGAPPAANVGGVGSEGFSQRAARADHRHPFPLATHTQHGALASQDKELIDSATVAVTPWSLAMRDGDGRLSTTFPATDDHAVNKGHLDWRLGGVTAPATWDATPNSIPKRGADGTFYVADPGKGANPATKTYVDGKTWDASRITSGILPYGRVWGSDHAYSTAWGGSGSIRAVHVTSGGEFCFYSSTRRHKTNIEEYRRTVAQILGPVPVEFDRLDPVTGVPTGVHDQGFIAEQAGEHLPELVYWGQDEDGNPQVDGWNYEGMIPGHQKVLRSHQRRINELEDTVSELSATVRKLWDVVAEHAAHLDNIDEDGEG